LLSAAVQDCVGGAIQISLIDWLHWYCGPNYSLHRSNKYYY